MAETFFHRKTAVFHYFQLAIEILARTHSRKPLWPQLTQIEKTLPPHISQTRAYTWQHVAITRAT